LAVSEGDEVRLRRKEMFEWSRVDMGWIQGHNWRIHPKWLVLLIIMTESLFKREMTKRKNQAALP
jgi:hypothetical protein